MAPLPVDGSVLVETTEGDGSWTPAMGLLVAMVLLAVLAPMVAYLCGGAAGPKAAAAAEKKEEVAAPTEEEAGEEEGEGEETDGQSTTTGGTVKKGKKKGKKGGKGKKKAAAAAAASKKEGGEEEGEGEELPAGMLSHTAAPSAINASGINKTAMDKTAASGKSGKSEKSAKSGSEKASPKGKKTLGVAGRQEYKTLAEANSAVFDDKTKGSNKDGPGGGYMSVVPDGKTKVGKKGAAPAASVAPLETLAGAASNVFDKEPTAKPAPKKKGKGKKGVAPLDTLAGADSNVFDAPKKKGKKGR